MPEIINGQPSAAETQEHIETDTPATALNTTHRSSDGSNHSKVGANETAIGLNTTHRGSDGSNHSIVNTVSGWGDHSGLYPTRAEWMQNGFPNRSDSSISFNNGTKRFTINPSNGSFDYFIAGVKYTVSSSDVENVNYVYLGDTPAEGPWYIYYVGSTLTAAVSPNHAAIRDIYENKAAVAIVFWDADNNKGQLLEDRHGMSMSPLTHILIHETVGTRFDTGLALNNVTADGNGNSGIHAQFGTDAGQIFDEDIEHSINAVGPGTGLAIWHRDASGWTFTAEAGYSILTTGTGRLAYDNSGTLTEVSDNAFVLCHIFATSMTHLNPVAVVGQAEYATKKLAQQGALTEIVNILSIADISPELKPIASLIFQTKDTYTNDVKARIVSTDEGDDYVDFRTDALLHGHAEKIEAAIQFVIDGGGNAITTGIKGDLEVPFECTIKSSTLLADQSGAIVIDIWKQAYADFPPEDANSITASAPPTITASGVKAQDATLSGWTKTLAKGDTLRFNVDSVATIERITLSLKVDKT